MKSTSSYKEKRVLILGANGYLGNRLSKHLQERGYKIVKCIRNIPNSNADGVDEYLSANMLEVRRYIQLNEIDWIINCVAVYEKAATTSEQIISGNYCFPAQIFSVAIELGVKNFLTIDTSLPKELNTYSFSKKQFAELGAFWCEKKGINFVNVLLEMFYGEDEPENRFFVSCCKKMMRGEQLLLTEGMQKRDIVYIQDVCLGIETILNSTISGYLDVPLGTGEAVAICEIIKYMHKYLYSKSELQFGVIPVRKGEPNCVADMSVIKGLGFENSYMWREGIAHFCDEIKKRIEDEGF